MSLKAATALVSLVLVAVPIAAFVVAGMRRRTPPPVTAATRLHHYELGKRRCAQTIRKIESQSGQGQLLGFRKSKYPRSGGPARARGVHTQREEQELDRGDAEARRNLRPCKLCISRDRKRRGKPDPARCVPGS
ncbi:MAG TPA: hypothetical protein VHS27_07190 [Gaiellales bacterium]|jgi:hypothetical protein|nr:hypothetical protein [Gaiellales bacterium]